MQANIELAERRIDAIRRALKRSLDEATELAESIKAVALEERQRNEEHDPEERSWLDNGVFGDELVAQYPMLFRSKSNLLYFAKHRKKNGMEAAKAVRKCANGRLQFHRKRAVRWALGG